MNKFWCGFFIFWPIVAIISCAISPAMNWWFPRDAEGSTVSATPLGEQIDDLFYLILWIVTVTFIGTQVALGYVLWRGSHNQDEKAWYTHGMHNLEVIWTIVPSVILLFIALYQLEVWAQYRVRSNFPQAAVDAPIAEVTARQFEWRIRYPGIDPQTGKPKLLRSEPQPDDLYTVNDLHVPINRPVLIYLRSGDVQHSFFVPNLRVKQDAMPGQMIPVWFEVMKPGDYDLTCAELCGWGHYKMRGRVMAQSEDDFQAYLQRLKKAQNYDGTGEPPESALAQNVKKSSEVQK